MSFALTLLLSLPTDSPVIAADLTDTEPPKVQLKLVQSLPSRGNAIIFDLVITDNKNEVKGFLAEEVEYIGFGAPDVQVAPACLIAQIFGGAKVQLFPVSSQIKNQDGSYESQWTLILLFNRVPPLPEGCPEWRKGKARLGVGPYFDDAAGNRSFVLTNTPTNNSVFSAYTNALDELLNDRGTPDVYCFMPPYSQESQSRFASRLAVLKSTLDPHRGKVYASKLLSDFDVKYPRYEESAKVYLETGKNGYSLEKFNKLPLCGNPTSFRREVFPASSNPFMEDFSELIKKLDLAKSQELKTSPGNTSVRNIVCKKGPNKITVSGKNPKCPKGFKKK